MNYNKRKLKRIKNRVIPAKRVFFIGEIFNLITQLFVVWIFFFFFFVAWRGQKRVWKNWKCHLHLIFRTNSNRINQKNKKLVSNTRTTGAFYFFLNRCIWSSLNSSFQKRYAWLSAYFAPITVFSNFQYAGWFKMATSFFLASFNLVLKSRKR